MDREQADRSGGCGRGKEKRENAWTWIIVWELKRWGMEGINGDGNKKMK